MRFNSVSETTRVFFGICQSLVDSKVSFSTVIRCSSVVDWSGKTEFVVWRRDPDHMNTGIEATLYPYNEEFFIQLTAGCNDLPRKFRNNIFWRDLKSDTDVTEENLPQKLHPLWEAATILATHYYQMKINVTDKQEIRIAGEGSYSLVWSPINPDIISVHCYDYSKYHLEKVEVTTLEEIMDFLKWDSKTHTCCWDEKIK